MADLERERGRGLNGGLTSAFSSAMWLALQIYLRHICRAPVRTTRERYALHISGENRDCWDSSNSAGILLGNLRRKLP